MFPLDNMLCVGVLFFVSVIRRVVMADYSIETSQSGEQLVLFELHVSLGDETWTISKRFSDFGRLRDSLIAECVGGSRASGFEFESDKSETFFPVSTKFSLAAELPPKTFFVNLDLDFINGRRAALQHYLDLILAQQCVSVSTSMFAFLSKSKQQSKVAAADKVKVEHQQAYEAMTINDVPAKAQPEFAAAEAERRAQEARAKEAADVKAAAGTCRHNWSKTDDDAAHGGSGSASSQTSSSGSLLSPSAAARRRHFSPTPPIGSAAAIAAHVLAVKALAAASSEHGAPPSGHHKIASPQANLSSSLSFLSEPPPSRRSSGGSQSRSRGGRDFRLSSPPATPATSAFGFVQASASKRDTAIATSALSAAAAIWPAAAAVGSTVVSPPPKSSPEAIAAKLQRALHAATSLHSFIGKDNGT